MTKQKIITSTPDQPIIWSMVYLNTIPIRTLSHWIKHGNRENRQPVEPKSVKQQSQQNKTEQNLWGGEVAIVLGGGGLLSEGVIIRGYCPGGYYLIILLPWFTCTILSLAYAFERLNSISFSSFRFSRCIRPWIARHRIA